MRKIFERCHRLAAISLVFLSLTSSISIAAGGDGDTGAQNPVTATSSPGEQRPLIHLKSLIPAKPLEDATKAAPTPAKPFSFGDSVTLATDNAQSYKDSSKNKRLIIMVDDYPITGSEVTLAPETETGLVTFTFTYSDADAKAWSAIYSNGRKYSRPFSLKLGAIPESGNVKDVEVISTQLPIHFAFINKSRLGLYACELLLLGILIIYLAKKGSFQDSAFNSYTFENRTYSLGRTQFICWVLVTALSLGWIFCVTYSIPENNPTTLITMLISAGAMGAGMTIDSNAKKIESSQLAEWNAKTSGIQKAIEAMLGTTQNSITVAKMQGAGVVSPPLGMESVLNSLDALRTDLQATAPSTSLPLKSEGLASDLLTNASGIAVQRLQMVMVNVLVGVYTLYSVWFTLELPELNETILGLLGISGGAYIIPKLNEKHS